MTIIGPPSGTLTGVREMFKCLLSLSLLVGLWSVNVANASRDFPVTITSGEQIERLRLGARDDLGHEQLELLHSQLLLGLEFGSSYTLIFTPAFFMEEGAIFYSFKYRLKSVLSAAPVPARCSSFIYSYPYIETPYGGDELSKIEGVCGEMATVHSALKLKLKKKKDAVKGDYFKKEALGEVSKFKKKFKQGMTMTEIKLAHQSLGAKECVEQKPVLTSDKDALRKFNQKLDELMAVKDRPWDCSLGMESRLEGGKLVLSHVEHITKVEFDKLSGGAEVETINGLTQGDRKTTVPAKKVGNTWYLVPKGFPPAGLSFSDSDKVAESLENIVLTKVEYVCCRKKK